VWNELNWLRISPVAGSFQCGNVFSDFTTDGKYLIKPVPHGLLQTKTALFTEIFVCAYETGAKTPTTVVYIFIAVKTSNHI
jgi:hypothetical protein